MAGRKGTRSMVDGVLDSQLNRVSEQEQEEQVSQLIAAIDKRLDELRAVPHESRLTPLVRLFDDVKPLARQILWERLVSETYAHIAHRPHRKEVDRKRLEQTAADHEIPELKNLKVQGSSEGGGCH